MRWVLVALASWLLPALAFASDKPLIAPAPGWVKVREAPDARPGGADGAPVRILLQDTQSNFGPDGDELYARSVARVQTSQGLSTLGTVVLNWNPEIDELTVHNLTIKRGDQSINVLAKQTFTVLRRENKLELAMLDGVLSATLQPEGLRVGDVLDLAFTVKQRDPVMKGKSETRPFWAFEGRVDQLAFRAQWTKEKSMRWRVTPGVDAPKVTSGELSLVMADVEAWRAPKGAPQRYWPFRALEMTEFASWADVSSLFAPLYEDAARLPADASLKAEIEEIRTRTSDPKARVEAALDLVQHEVRYVFLGMNRGALIPANAETTWSRRFGDCKAKTALLIAILTQLGIKAEPALVHSALGDGLDVRLPMVSQFDHVIVRAELNGRVYWLDGTSFGDKSLDAVRVPPFYWALPVRRAGAVLERLTPAQLSEPDLESVLRLDASAGRDARAKLDNEVIFRGGVAKVYNAGFSAMSAGELDRSLREYWRTAMPDATIATASWKYDERKVEGRLAMSGDIAMEWVADGRNYAYEIDDAGLGSDEKEFHREAGPQSDAPFMVSYPFFVRGLTSIVLPDGGRGYTIIGEDVEQVAGGVEFRRNTRIENGVLKMENTSRSLVPEFPASQAASSSKILQDLAKLRLWVSGPATSSERKQSDAARAKAASAPAETVRDFVERSRAKLQVNDVSGALRDAERAVALDGADASAYEARGSALIVSKDIVKARADLEKAISLDPKSWYAYSGLGLIANQEGRFQDAIAAYTKLIEGMPKFGIAYTARSEAYHALRDYDKALADVNEGIRLGPGSAGASYLRARILAAQGKNAEALADANAAIAADPDLLEALGTRATILMRLGRREEAFADVNHAVKELPVAQNYYSRATLREETDIAGRRADLLEAIRRDPTFLPAHALMVSLEIDDGKPEEALRRADNAVKLFPGDLSLKMARAEALVALGRHAAAEAEFDAVRRVAPPTVGTFNNLCWSQATMGVALEKALADCDAALKLSPQSGPVLDSRAFVLLKLGRFDAALLAYDEALKVRPRQDTSLYGRGITRLRKGLIAEGNADLAAARAIDPGIDGEFKGYGVQP